MLPTTSFLVERQLPGFVREEYPVFIEFLKKYYEFVELQTFSDSADSATFNTDITNITTDQV